MTIFSQCMKIDIPSFILSGSLVASIAFKSKRLRGQGKANAITWIKMWKRVFIIFLITISLLPHNSNMKKPEYQQVDASFWGGGHMKDGC